MPSHEGAVAPIFRDWAQYNDRLIGGVRDLTAEQLAIRAGPNHAPIWALAGHVAGVRVYWLCGVFGEPGAETTPFPDPFFEIGWEDDEENPRRADELVFALESTWAVVAGCLARWTPAMLEEGFERVRDAVIQVHTRQSVLMRLLSHDAFHSGEISQLLGVHGLPPIDLWSRPAP